ncbi:MAG: PEP-CTERM sorting domain-containing protein [Planctomycetes bacterium]|nr:PEP-CTERM sorting domain-containing protein [Planctomycetota bacterium]
MASAQPPVISDPEGMLPVGTETPGTFPETVTSANVNFAPVAGSVLGGSGSNSLLATFPSAGPIAWTDVRHNEGDVALAIGPFDPNDPSYYPPATHGEWKPLADGQPFSNATLAWRVNSYQGALLATVRHNGVDNLDTSSGSPVGITNGVANFIDGTADFAQGWGFRMNDGEFRNGGNGSSDLIMGVAGFDNNNHEASFNIAAAMFPYQEGWQGAWVDSDTGGEAVFNASNPDIPTSSVNWSGGSAQVLLPGVDSANDGMLFVASSNSSSMTQIAAGAPRAGGWDVTIRDDEDADTSGLTLSGNSRFQFLYVPYDANNLVGGYADGSDGSLNKSAGSDRFSLARNSDGEYALTVLDSPGGAKLNEDNGMLILSVASRMAGTTDKADRSFLSYEYDPNSGDFIIQSRELAATSSPNSENQFGDWLKLRDSDFYFAWVDFANPLSLGFTADFDNDGDVDGDDLIQWKSEFGVNGGSDADGDGDSDGADFLTWQRQRGSGVPVVTSATTVPEPATVVIGLLGLLVGTSVRRRHR